MRCQVEARSQRFGTTPHYTRTWSRLPIGRTNAGQCSGQGMTLGVPAGGFSGGCGNFDIHLVVPVRCQGREQAASRAHANRGAYGLASAGQVPQVGSTLCFVPRSRDGVFSTPLLVHHSHTKICASWLSETCARTAPQEAVRFAYNRHCNQ